MILTIIGFTFVLLQVCIKLINPGSAHDEINEDRIVSFTITLNVTAFLLLVIYNNIYGTIFVTLAESLRSLRQFLRRFSHEIRSPLHTIQFTLESLSELRDTTTREMNSDDHTNFQELLSDGKQAMDILVGIINETVMMGSDAVSDMNLKRRVFQLNELLLTISSIFDREFVSKQVTFDFSVCHRKDLENIMVDVDRQKIFVMMKILLNGVLQLSGKHDRVELDVRFSFREDKNKILPFVESGVDCVDMIDEENSLKATKFVRVLVKCPCASLDVDFATEMLWKNSTKYGSGNSWGVAEAIAKAHDGRLDFCLCTDPQEMLFTVELPFCKSSSCTVASVGGEDETEHVRISNVKKFETDIEYAECVRDAEHTQSEAKHQGSSRQIWALVVEDTLVCSKVLVKAMKEHHIECTAVYNGRQAVDEIIANPSKYDIILMDNTMPVMDGTRATAAIRELNYTNPIIGLTGNVMPDDVNTFLDAGVNEVMGKPIQKKEISMMLSRYGIVDQSLLEHSV